MIRHSLLFTAAVSLAALLLPACAGGDGDGSLWGPGGKADDLSDCYDACDFFDDACFDACDAAAAGGSGDALKLDLRGTVAVPSFRTFGMAGSKDAATGYFFDAIAGAKVLVSLTKDDGTKPQAALGVYGPVTANEVPWTTKLAEVTSPDRATGGSAVTVDVAETGTYFVQLKSQIGFRSSSVRYALSITCDGTEPCVDGTLPQPRAEGECLPGGFTLPEGEFTSLVIDRCDVTLKGKTSVDKNFRVTAGTAIKMANVGVPQDGAMDTANNGRASLDVSFGDVVLQGNADAPITFDTAKPGQPWWGVVLSGTDAQLSFVNVSNARLGLDISGTATVGLSDVNVTYDAALATTLPGVYGVLLKTVSSQTPTFERLRVVGYPTGIDLTGNLNLAHSYVDAGTYGIIANPVDNPGTTFPTYALTISGSAVVAEGAALWLKSGLQHGSATIDSSVLRAGDSEALHLESGSVNSRGLANTCGALPAISGTATVTQSDLLSAKSAAIAVAGGTANVVTVDKSNLVSGNGAPVSLSTTNDFATAGSHVLSSNVVRGTTTAAHLLSRLSHDPAVLSFAGNHYATYGQTFASDFVADVTVAECDEDAPMSVDAGAVEMTEISDAGPLAGTVPADVAAVTWAAKPTFDSVE